QGLAGPRRLGAVVAEQGVSVHRGPTQGRHHVATHWEVAPVSGPVVVEGMPGKCGRSLLRGRLVRRALLEHTARGGATASPRKPAPILRDREGLRSGESG